MKRALFVATIMGFLNFEKNDIKILHDLGYEIHIATDLNAKSGEINFDVPVIQHQVDFARSPLSMKNIAAYNQLNKLIIEHQFEIIHCHTPVGGVLARLSARKMRKKGTRVIYTAHGFHFYKGAPFLNWLLFYPVEKYCSKLTDVLITINKEDYEFAKKKMNAKRIEYIPGVGIDTDKFGMLDIDKAAKRKELGVPEDAVLILSVGELNKNKNHIKIIEALKNSNDNIHYVIAGRGVYERIVYERAKELGIGDRIHLLGFRNDVAEIYKAADIFVFPSYREGLSVALMEAMANKLPVVCSRIRGNVDLIDENKGGFLCSSGSSDEFAEKISKLVNDENLRNQFGEYNLNKIKVFDVKKIIKEMERIYWEV